MQATRTATRPQMARRTSVRVTAQKPNLAQAAVAVMASALLVVAPIAVQPVLAADVTEGVRKVLCASNPTSAICLKGSFARGPAAAK